MLMDTLLATLIRKSNSNANRILSGRENYAFLRIMAPLSMGAFRSSTSCGKLQPNVTLAVHKLISY